jgi:hypothetical protein
MYWKNDFRAIEHTTKAISRTTPMFQIASASGPGIKPFLPGSNFRERDSRWRGEPGYFFDGGGGVGNGAGPFAIITELPTLPLLTTVFRPIEHTRIARTRASAASLRDMVPP